MSDATSTVARALPITRGGWRVAIYVRVSTDKQDTGVQLPALERLCDARAWIDRDVFEEVESAGKTRPVLERLCDRTRRGEFRVLICWALDRLGRSMYEVIDRIRSLDAAGVRVVSYSEPWLDTGGPTRELLLALFGWIAEQERRRLIERTRAGLERARARGRRLGRPPQLADGTMVLRLRAEGCSWATIARQLGCTIAAARGAAARGARTSLAENGAPNEGRFSDEKEVSK